MVQLLHKTISVFPNVYLIKNISHRTIFKVSLKIPKGSSESVNRRRTDNIMVKRKRTNNDLENIHIKLKIE